MRKFTLTSKAKKKKLLYYNIQLSVDKDCSASNFHPPEPGGPVTYFYKDSPIILTFSSKYGSNYWKSDSNSLYTEKHGDQTVLIHGVIPMLNICEGEYPLPEIISVVENGVTFTFTPIPVYE